MTRGEIRRLLAVTAVAAVVAYGLSGHGLPHLDHDAIAGAAGGLCLLLATVVVYAAPPKPAVRRVVLVEDAVTTYVAAPADAAPDGRARASPIALHRFRN